MVKISGDWWRHLGAQLATAIVVAALTALGHVDWSVFGPYAGLPPMLVGLATELFNQALATPVPWPPAKAADAPPPPPGPKLGAQAWLALLPLLAMLSGCAQWQAITGIASSTVNPNYAAAAIQAFDAAETVADGYLKLPACVAGGAKVCRSKAAVAAIVPAVRTGRAARDAVQSALAASNGGPIAVASYNNLESVVTTLQAVYTNYNIALPANVTGN